MNNTLAKIKSTGILPVVTINDESKAVNVAHALMKGGIPCAEITFRTPCAAKAIENITKAVPEMIVGAGTVLTCEQLDRAVAAGSKFVVSPGFNPKVIAYAQKKGVLMIPGTSVASEIEQALEMGLKIVKFFPAEASGGLKKIKSLSAPYQNINFMPTGGINENNIQDYIKFKRIFACGGSWMVTPDMIDNNQYDEITSKCQQAIRKMFDFKIEHVGINCENADEAIKTAKLLYKLFGFEYNENSASIFAGNRSVEIMKSQFLGKNGHIAVLTNSLSRSIDYFRNMGFEFNESTVTEVAAYFKDELAGFAIHLLQNK